MGVLQSCASVFRMSLNLGVGVKARDLLLEDEVRAHAVVREVPDALLVFGAVGVAVEVAHARPLGVFEQLHQEEGALLVFAGEAQVLVVAAGLLAVQVDVEELARFERLADAVREVEPGICSCAISGLSPTISG